MIQLIDKKNIVFLINNDTYQYVKPKFLYKNFNIVLEAKIKGSTIGWYIDNKFISYNKLKKVYNTKALN